MPLTPEQEDELREFLRRLTHELRDPLTSIQGYAEVILLSKNEDLVENAHTYAEAILTNTQKMLKLIDQIKEFRQQFLAD